MIDTHAHLNFSVYKDDIEEVIERSLGENVWMINVGSQYGTSKRAVDIAQKYKEGVYAAVGLHPIHLQTGLVKIKDDPEEVQFKSKEEEFDLGKYRELALDEKVVAIGEIGLDYYWKPKTKVRIEQFKEKQKKVLLGQLNLAKDLSLPVIFHCRMGHDDLIEILRDHKIQGVIHCFTGNLEQAKQYLDMGMYIGLNGIIFKMNLDEIIEKMPLGRILLETDCPYLIPPQEEGRNEPVFIKHVAEKVAQIKDLKVEELIKITTENAKKLFKI
ncbi:MAG: TatD family hydrolase [Candidatus Nealsonbacteria bacterium]